MKWIYAVGLRAGGAFGLFEIVDGFILSDSAQTVSQQLEGAIFIGSGLLAATVAAGLAAIYATLNEPEKHLSPTPKVTREDGGAILAPWQF